MSRYLVGILFCLVIALVYAAFRDEAFQDLRHHKIRKRDIRQKQKGALNFWFYTALEKEYGLGKYGVLLRLYPIAAGSFTVLHITFGWMDALADRIAARNSSPSKVVLMLDGRELGWATINNINAITKQTGGLQLLV